MPRAVLVVAALTAFVPATSADTDDTAARPILYARGGKLLKADARGRGETEIAALPAKRTLRVLRTDAAGTVVLADIGGTWAWMPLDGSTKALTDLPCEAGPASLSVDGTYVLCRRGTVSIVVNLKSTKVTELDVPAAGARLVGIGSDLRLVWADRDGVWTAVPPQRKAPKEVAPETPLRHLAVSPDGTHAVGVYADEIFLPNRQKKAADVLSIFALDGTAARRKAIQNGVPIEWSHDSKWVLIQDGSSACVMFAAGGQYKCWRGYHAVSIAPDGKYALLMGAPREAKSEDKSKKSKAKKSKTKTKAKAKAAPKPVEAAPEGEPELPGDEHGDEPIADDELPVPLPTGPLSLYRAEVEGAFTKSPALIARDVEGSAVWVSAPQP